MDNSLISSSTQMDKLNYGEIEKFIYTIIKRMLKCKTHPLSFFRIYFSFNFVFVHFSPLIFKFIQLRHFLKLLLKLFEKKNLVNAFQSLIDFFFNLKKFKEKLKKLKILPQLTTKVDEKY